MSGSMIFASRSSRLPRAGASPIASVMVCELCGQSPAPYRCDWRVEKLVEVRCEEILHGDRMALICTSNDAWPVVDIAACSSGLTFHVELQKGKRAHRFLWFGDPGRVLRMAPCGIRACEACAMERGEAKYVCARHWWEWEKVA